MCIRDRFQLNLGLPSDGIAGAYTYAAIRNLHHSWEGKEAVHEAVHLGFARAADVLESNALCLFGTHAVSYTHLCAPRAFAGALSAGPVILVPKAGPGEVCAPSAPMRRSRRRGTPWESSVISNTTSRR